MSEVSTGYAFEFYSHSRFFTVRVWCEDLGDGRIEWRGKVQNVATGEAHYFRGWPMLIARVQEMLDEHSR